MHGVGVWVDAVGHHGSIRGGQGTGPACSSRSGGGSSGWVIGTGGVAIGAEGIGLLVRLRLRLRWGRGVRMTAQAGTLEQVLLLARGVFGADLLAIDALDGEALEIQS